jgi:hypothetical protein
VVVVLFLFLYLFVEQNSIDFSPLANWEEKSHSLFEIKKVEVEQLVSDANLSPIETRRWISPIKKISCQPKSKDKKSTFFQSGKFGIAFGGVEVFDCLLKKGKRVFMESKSSGELIASFGMISTSRGVAKVELVTSVSCCVS